jgi:hypothetical protein
MRKKTAPQRAARRGGRRTYARGNNQHHFFTACHSFGFPAAPHCPCRKPGTRRDPPPRVSISPRVSNAYCSYGDTMPVSTPQHAFQRPTPSFEPCNPPRALTPRCDFHRPIHPPAAHFDLPHPVSTPYLLSQPPTTCFGLPSLVWTANDPLQLPTARFGPRLFIPRPHLPRRASASCLESPPLVCTACNPLQASTSRFEVPALAPTFHHPLLPYSTSLRHPTARFNT